jgi:hypothetical protein
MKRRSVASARERARECANELARNLAHTHDLPQDDSLADELAHAHDLAREIARANAFAGGSVTIHNHAVRLADELAQARDLARTHDLAHDLTPTHDLARAVADAGDKANKLREKLCPLELVTPDSSAPARCQITVVPVAGRIAHVAARILPPADRARYCDEYRSELYELAAAGAWRWGQLMYAVRLLDRAWVLRAELRVTVMRQAEP